MSLLNSKSSSPEFGINPTQGYFLCHFTLPRSIRLYHLVILNVHLSIEIQYLFWFFID